MDKAAILKAWVSGELHENFLTVCAASGKATAAVMPCLGQRHVTENRHLLEDHVRVSIEQPKDYQYGACRARIALRTPDAMCFHGTPVPFELPRLEARRVHQDDGYAVATANWDGQGSGLSGIFVNGAREGHVYSNGVDEDGNPTSIDDVCAVLKAAVADRVSTAR